MEVGGGLTVGRGGALVPRKKMCVREGKERKNSEFSREKGLGLSQALWTNTSMINESDVITD